MPDKVDEVLAEARNLLGKSGELWYRSLGYRSPQSSPHHNCVLSAIWNTVFHQAVRWTDKPFELFDLACMRFKSKNGISDIPQWNDVPTRKFADVDYAFRVARGEVM